MTTTKPEFDTDIMIESETDLLTKLIYGVSPLMDEKTQEHIRLLVRSSLRTIVAKVELYKLLWSMDTLVSEFPICSPVERTHSETL